MRRGIALVLVLSLAVLLLLAAGALFEQGQDAVAQAARVEGRLALSALLRSAAEEAWWLVMNPGRFPPPPSPADPGPIALYAGLRAPGTGPGEPAVTVPITVATDRTTRLPVGGSLKVLEVTARGRDRREVSGIPQGTIELHATGEFRADRVALRLGLVELRAYWLAGPPRAARLEVGDAPLAQDAEELP